MTKSSLPPWLTPLRSLLLTTLTLCLIGTACSDDDVKNNGNNQNVVDMTAVDDMRTDMNTPDQAPDLGKDMEPDLRPPVDMNPDMVTPPVDIGDDMDPPDIEVTALRLDALVPPRGPLDGGTSFVIDGVGLTQDSIVYFGGRQAQVDLIEGKLVGVSPEGVIPGPVDVKVVDAVYGEDTLSGGFTYTATLTLDAVTPSRIPTTGMVEVTLNGRGFNDQTRVSFGGNTALRHTLVDGSLLRVIAPPHAAGLVDVRATNRDASATLPQAITYFEALRLDAVRPATGKTAGNEVVELQGSGFVPGMTVRFGNAQATLGAVTPAGDKANVTTPANTAGLVAVTLVTPTQDATVKPDAFFYADDALPSLANITPDQGPITGGVEVTIIGANLDDPNISVLIGGNAATIIEQGPGHIVVRTPAGTLGAADVTVTDGTDSDTLMGAYTYVSALWIDRVTPNSADVTGNIPVVIDGEGFTGATKVLFGPNAAQFTVDSNTKITATAPPGAAGSVDLVIERDGVKATFKDGFTYTEQLVVSSMTPVRGAVAGGTYVELRGRGFIGDLDVTFGTEDALNITILDSQTLAVRTPPNPSGDVTVTVTRQADSAQAPTPYTYFNPGARSGGAWGNPINGAVNVTVYSTSGTPIENAFVMLSTRADTRYQGLTTAEGMVTLSGPDVFGDQTITAIAAGHSSATVQRVNAENITIFLNPPPNPGQPPPGTAPAVFKGYLDGLDKVAEPGPGEFRMAIVYTTQSDTNTDNPAPGNGNVLLTNGQYTLRSRLGDVAVIALGGLYNNNTNTFKPLSMGIKRYLFASEGMEYQVNLELNIPLTQQLTIKLNNAPRGAQGPDLNVVRPWLDLGFEGVFGELALPKGQGGILVAQTLAPLSGVLADASYFLEGGAYTGADLGAPFSVGLKRNIKVLNQTIELPGLLDTPQIISPQSGARPLNGLVTFTYNNPIKPDLYYVRIETPMQALRWEAFLPGTATSLRLPTFPDFSNLPADQRPAPYTGELVFLVIYAIKQPGLDFNNFTYNDLGIDKWEAYAINFQLIQL